MTVSRPMLHCAALLAAALVPLCAHADPCQLEINANDQMQYEKTELSAPASCKQVTVTLRHTGKLPKQAMGHDWVLVNGADFAAVASAGMNAGLAADYVAPGDKNVIAHTKIIGGGENDTVTFATSAMKKGGTYSYLCTFPGHSVMMHGVFKLT
ncbi:MAG TPA: azurin [Steroidobacteraceae bacterium]|nr:azurin [Steroidobacteraceae bacterium]